MDNLITYKYRINTNSKVIYISILTFLIVVCICLLFVKIGISIKSPGLLQSAIEKSELFIPVNGRLSKLNIRDNQKVEKGDKLLIIDASMPRQQDALVESRRSQINQLLQDVNLLTKLSENQGQSPDFQTPQYAASWQQYLQELQSSRNLKQQALQTFDRYEKLYKNGVITAAEYEQYQFDYNQAVSNEMIISRKFQSQWQIEANQYRNELHQLSSQQAQIIEQKKQYILRAPISGTLQNIIGLQQGAYMFANQKIGEISPDSTILAYCYINPSDIGLIVKGQTVRFQVDSYNYNQWGMLTGKVVDIADDITIINNNQPVFKIKCSLDKEYLQLKNGYKGYFKKGMSLTARFNVAERSLYQLLYDKVDNWVNPNISSIK